MNNSEAIVYLLIHLWLIVTYQISNLNRTNNLHILISNLLMTRFTHNVNNNSLK